ncbi:MAG TPA: MFS transporter [Methyloceanibacter sp.]|nr:MFS transporter [Methyloceanibacter sp.]
MAPTLEQRTIRKVSWRLLPLIIVIYFVAYIDRTNVSFAALTMNKDLGLSAYVFGWGAGIFFLGYFLFEVPSNVILEKTGARIWIARIMVTWGLVSGAMAFATGPASFLTLRFLLGVAEAGFFPGMILYFTYWFPKAYRARVISALFIAVPGSNALAAVISGAILEMDGLLGLAGWQWMFIVEAIPAVLLAVAVLALMTDRPAVASWLAPEEREWLETRLQEERRRIESAGHLSLARALTDRRVLALSAIYFTIVTATYGITFFLPQIVRGIGLSNVMTGLVTAIPYTIGTIGMLLWGASSDRRDERRWHFCAACLLAAVGLVGAGLFDSSFLALAFMSVATVGLYGSKPAFWPMPSTFLTGTAAAGGIALVNSIGNLGGYVGPFVVGWIKDGTGSFEAGLYFLAASALMSGIVAYLAVQPTERATVPSDLAVRAS